MLSLVVGGVTFLPKISVGDAGSLRASDPMGTVFDVSNDGTLPVYNLQVTCGIDDLEHGRFKNFAFTVPESFAQVLSPGHKMTVPCGHAVAMISASSAAITLLVDYRPPLVWWHRTEKFPLEAEKNQDGNWVWKKLPQ